MKTTHSIGISTHTPLAGRDYNKEHAFAVPCIFLLTRPSRGATGLSVLQDQEAAGFLLTRPSRGATMLTDRLLPMLTISTHTPLAGRDPVSYRPMPQLLHFYSHAPRGARHRSSFWLRFPSSVLLTRPSRGATPPSLPPPSLISNFYSHAPRGARLGWASQIPNATRFLLTRPSRGATAEYGTTADYLAISTHTPLAGRDLLPTDDYFRQLDFYSHAPRGARRPRYKPVPRPEIISTHTPLAGRDG